eukprot:3397358-Rhodomonas_salina.1
MFRVALALYWYQVASAKEFSAATPKTFRRTLHRGLSPLSPTNCNNAGRIYKSRPAKRRELRPIL